MFHQVYVEPKDRNAFLWWPTGDLNEEPREYCMVKHLFGATLLPACANFCLMKTASIYQSEFDPVTAQTVTKNMYVDDLMKSVSSPEIAMRLPSQLRELLVKGGFRLTKWLSNDRNEKPMTRCGVLSAVSSLFDPLGFISPFIMKAKLLLQELCRKKVGWDGVINEQERVQWLR